MMAKSLDANGAAKVFIIGRRAEKLQEVAAEAINKSIVPIQGDMSSKESIAACVAKVQAEVEFVNCVIANHGAQGPTVNALPKDRTPTLDEMYQHLWKPSMQEFNEAFEVNSTGAFYMMVAFMPLLDAGNNHKSSPTPTTGVKSQFIITGSISAFSRRPGMGFAYSASKAGAVVCLYSHGITRHGLTRPAHDEANIHDDGTVPHSMQHVQSRNLPFRHEQCWCFSIQSFLAQLTSVTGIPRWERLHTNGINIPSDCTSDESWVN